MHPCASVTYGVTQLANARHPALPMSLSVRSSRLSFLSPPAAAARAFSRLRQAITTVQPWSIKALVVHNPTPEEAPVTITGEFPFHQDEGSSLRISIVVKQWGCKGIR